MDWAIGDGGGAATQNLRQPYAKILTKAGVYQLTPDDVLWAARSAYFEGGHPADVLWTETQRFVLYRRDFTTFAQFVQAFSQPINPDWRRDGKFCRPGGKYAGRPECSPAALAKREDARTVSWGMLATRKPELIDVVSAWANGRLPNPVPRSTNFAAPDVSASWLSKHDGDVIKTAGNVYIVEAPARGWSPNHVTLQGHDGAVANADGVAIGSRTRQFASVLLNALSKPLRTRV